MSGILLPGISQPAQPQLQEGDGINVAAWSTGDVRVVFTEQGVSTAYDLNPLIALEVAGRMLQMAHFQLVRQGELAAAEAGDSKPKHNLTLVPGSLPKSGQ